MTENNINSHKGFKHGVLGIGLILLLIVLTQITHLFKSDFGSLLIGLLTFAVGIISIIGFIKSLKGIKEPNTAKKIIGIVINFGIIMLFLSAIVANIYDIYMALT